MRNFDRHSHPGTPAVRGSCLPAEEKLGEDRRCGFLPQYCHAELASSRLQATLLMTWKKPPYKMDAMDKSHHGSVPSFAHCGY